MVVVLKLLIMVIMDFLRVLLIWYDDEIMIYDFDDSDDDGMGINGIGFKFMVVVVYVRMVKRK